jgi:hypothetical protein
VNELLAASPLEPTAAGPSVLGFACAAVVRRDAFLAVSGLRSVVDDRGERELRLLSLDVRPLHPIG